MSDARRFEPGLRFVLSGLMVGVGILHFASPAFYVELMPRAIPEGLHVPLVLCASVSLR